MSECIGGRPYKRHQNIIVALIATVLPMLWVWYQLDWSGRLDGFLYLGNDTSSQFQVFKFIYDSYFTFSEFPAWNPHYLYGQSFQYWYHQIGPIDYIFLLLGKALEVRNSYFLFNASLAVQVAIMGAGSALLFRRLRTPWPILFLLVSLVLLSAEYRFGVFHTLRGFYLMPFMILFVIDFMDKPKPGNFSGMALTWAALLFGNVGYVVIFVFYATLILLAVLLFLKKDRMGFLRDSISLFKRPAVYVAILFAAVASFLYFLYFIASDRMFDYTALARGGRDLSLKIPYEVFVIHGDLPLDQLLEAISYLFLKSNTAFLGFHVGFLCMFFSFYLFLSRPPLFAKALLALIGLGLLLFTDVLASFIRYVLYWLPGASYYQNHVPVFTIMSFAFLMLSAFGAQRYLQDLMQGTYKFPGVGSGKARKQVLILLFFVAMLLFGMSFDANIITKIRILIEFIPFLLCLFILPLVARRFSRNKAIIQGLFACVLGVSVAVSFYTFHSLQARYIASSGKVDEAIIPREFFVRDFDLPTSRSMDTFENKPLFGYNWAVNSSWLASTGQYPCSSELGSNTIARSFANFMTDVARPFVDRELDVPFGGDYYLHYVAEGAGGVMTNLMKESAFRKYIACDLSIVRISENVNIVASADNAAKIMKDVFNNLRPFTDVVLAPGRLDEENVLPQASAVEVSFYSPNKVEFLTQSETPSWLIYTDPFDPRWKATLDGVESDIYIANAGFKAVWLPAGQHEVAFSFENQYFHKGILAAILVSISSLALVLLLAAKVSFASRPINIIDY